MYSELNEFIYSCEARKLSHRTIKSNRNLNRAFFVYLDDEEYVDKNPMLKVRFVKDISKAIEVYTDEEVLVLLFAFDETDYLSFRNNVILSLQLDTGIRCTEICDIELNDFMSDRTFVHGKGNKQRLVASLCFNMFTANVCLLV